MKNQTIYKKRYLFCAVILAMVFSDALVVSNMYSFPSVGDSTKQESRLQDKKEIRTPKPPSIPRINGPSLFGVRPMSPFLYRIPTTGDRPMKFSVAGLPSGLKLDSKNGQITGSLKKRGTYDITLRAKNDRGSAERKFKIIVGETIALTPPLGWNSWNCWGPMVDADKVLKSAKAMVSSRLIDHGWTYINIDDAWQGKRGGKFNGIQGNEKFSDMKGLCDTIHAMGLKVGIYSTPWVTSYARYIGGSADNLEGNWPPPVDTNLANNRSARKYGKYSFAENDARQWAAWGMDYLKYDWNPKNSNPPETPEEFHKNSETMAKALYDSGRDILFSYSNSMPFEQVGDQSKIYNCWRTTGDIQDSWWSLSNIGFSQNRWADFSSPGHWNDPDMLVVGVLDVGKGRNLHPSNLTPDEQYAHITLWSLLASPLLIGCDMDRLDEFTFNLLSNDEVLAVNQDALGKQARLVSEQGGDITIIRPNRPDQKRTYARFQIWARDLEDGSKAVGFFNLGDQDTTIAVQWTDLKLAGSQIVRDLWRQKDLGKFGSEFKFAVAPHGAELFRIRPLTTIQKAKRK